MDNSECEMREQYQVFLFVFFFGSLVPAPFLLESNKLNKLSLSLEVLKSMFC